MFDTCKYNYSHICGILLFRLDALYMYLLYVCTYSKYMYAAFRASYIHVQYIVYVVKLFPYSIMMIPTQFCWLHVGSSRTWPTQHCQVKTVHVSDLGLLFIDRSSSSHRKVSECHQYQWRLITIANQH